MGYNSIYIYGFYVILDVVIIILMVTYQISENKNAKNILNENILSKTIISPKVFRPKVFRFHNLSIYYVGLISSINRRTQEF